MSQEMCSVTSWADSDAQSGEWNPWLDSNYTADDFRHNLTANGVTFDETAGTFEVTGDGDVFRVKGDHVISQANADVACTLRIKVEGSTQVTIPWHTSNEDSPTRHPFVGYVEAATGEKISITLESASGTITALAGSNVSIVRMAKT